MKKTYMQPFAEVVKVNAEQLICQSGGIEWTSGSGSGPLNLEEASGDALGKEENPFFDPSLW